MKSITPELVGLIRSQYLKLYSQKPSLASSYLKDASLEHNISYQTLHRHLNLSIRTQRRVNKQTLERQREREHYANAIWKFIEQKTYDDFKPTVTVAYNYFRNHKRIPDHITRNHIYEALDRMNIKTRSVQGYKRFERENPMSLWQVDFSKSRYFIYKGGGADGNGSELMVKPPNYTKRDSKTGLSLYLGVALDDASRVTYVEYFIASGENQSALNAFLFKSFEQKEGKRLLQGKPTSIYMDRGSAQSSKATEDGLAKLGIDLVLGADVKNRNGQQLRVSNKQARGKVERAIRTIKESMESAMFLELEDGHRMSLFQLNQLVSDWVEAWNDKPHPVRFAQSRWEAFMPALESMTFPAPEEMAGFSTIVTKAIRRGRINVARNTFCLAPGYLEEGQKVEVLFDGKQYYAFHEGVRHPLVLEIGLNQELQREARARVEANGGKVRQTDSRGTNSFAVRVELQTDVLTGTSLRSRFDEEIHEIAGLRIKNISDEIWNEIVGPLNSPMTIAEMKKYAVMVCDRVNPRRKKIIPHPRERAAEALSS